MDMRRAAFFSTDIHTEKYASAVSWTYEEENVGIKRLINEHAADKDGSL